MISVPEAKRPKSGRILEIAIVISVAVHLLLGGLTTFNHPWLTKIMQRFTPPDKKQEDISALSTAITLEKRTKPQRVPPSRPQPQIRPVPPQPRVVAQVPKTVVKPEAVKPLPRPKPTEIAKIVPHAKELQAPQPVPSGDRITNQKPTQVARIAVPQPKQQFDQEQVAEMQQRFAQAIAQARAMNNPTRVAAQAPGSTMKRAKLDIAGVDRMMRNGEGYLTPREMFPATVDGGRGECYYVDYQIQFSDGTTDSGPVYWPICYQDRKDPFANRMGHFPLPGPQPNWQPNANQWQVIASHKLLRLYFPDKFPDGGSPPSGDAGN